MTQEQKQLLLKDICSRLPYKIKGVLSYDKDKEIFTIEGCEIEKCILYLSNSEGCYVDDFKPFLRNMSSMTEDEFDEFSDIIIPVDGGKAVVEEENLHKYVDFCNSHYLDWRNLIPTGLAIEAPKDMYNIKKK